MENASKALLIAGAILLVIALIAIGMAILGQGERTVNNVAGEMDALEIQAQNQRVTPYLSRELSSTDFGKLKSAAASLGINMGAAVYNAAATAEATGFTADGLINKINYNGVDYTTP